MRQTQHRPQREEQLRSQETAELKRQNRILTRQVARLQKENLKLRAMPDPEPEPVSDSVDTPIQFDRCAVCRSMNVKDTVLPTGTKFRLCGDCGERTKI